MRERQTIFQLGVPLFQREVKEIQHLAVFQRHALSRDLLLVCVTAGSRSHVFPPTFVEQLQVTLLGEEYGGCGGQVVPCEPVYREDDSAQPLLWRPRYTEKRVPYGFELLVRPSIRDIVLTNSAGTRVTNVRGVRLEHIGGRVEIDNVYFRPGHDALLRTVENTA